ncbi:integrase/recombinase [mine drainage metagenome]|uniref:Integrase/recombinase n=1 Tax=mine drainage metagenome TaxID=410659 RepID=T1CGJ5_9ZZZZ
MIGDLPEVGAKTVRFPKTPTPIVVRRDVSKANLQYFTFTGEEGAEAVVDYLHSRVEALARWEPTTPLHTPERTDLTNRRFVRTSEIGNAIRLALRPTGLPNRPHALRTTAASRCTECESRGLRSHSVWQHRLGHPGDLIAWYSVNDLPSKREACN